MKESQLNKIWITSDTHFFHVNILKYNRPQFKDVDEMNEFIIKQWNECIGPEDIVYHLGDFAFDQLQAIVEESNRYNEIPTECLEMLNISPEVDGDRFRVEVKNLGSKKYSLPKGKEYVYTNPLDESGFGIDLECQGSESEYFRFRPEDMKYYQDNEVVFVKDDVEIKLKKVAVDDNLWRFIV